MESFKNSPLYLFETADQWRDWLDKNHSLTPCVWLKLAKKGSAVTTLSYEQARNTAIAYGWIDGLINGLDKDVYLTRFTPRKPKSVWSKANREVAEGLIESGRMQPSGMACVEAARKGGMWERAFSARTRRRPAGGQSVRRIERGKSVCVFVAYPNSRIARV